MGYLSTKSDPAENRRAKIAHCLAEKLIEFRFVDSHVRFLPGMSRSI